MLPISIPAQELFNEQTGEFLTIGPYYLELEHSLKSISKWEAKTHKSFFEDHAMSPEDFQEYVKCMTLNRITDPTVYQHLRPSDYREIGKYMTDTMSAKNFRPKKKKKWPHVTMTSETIYSLMIVYGIPFECDKWHFNRLSALIKTCEQNGMGEGTMSYSERQRYYNELNDQRRKMLNTKG